ncbi:hypothetical protein CK203_026570 [Vitis vinifera]|uniref:Uncharacterized protein n=1 Tax=Vitis vinifera TaxID=29760 RepID=A0A438ITT8_VITVI|nr:hypothetical protein CK203_026570 [Vitis vinifera]
MCCVNSRFFVLYAINIFKTFQVGTLGWDWDPYNIMGDLSWMKVICLLDPPPPWVFLHLH